MNRTAWWLALLAVVLCGFPFLAGEFYINLVSQILIAALFASSLNLLVGYAGLGGRVHSSGQRKVQVQLYRLQATVMEAEIELDARQSALNDTRKQLAEKQQEYDQITKEISNG